MTLENNSTSGQKQSKHCTNFDNFETALHESKDLKKTYALADKLALLDEPLLILGEAGVGKSYLARYIHKHSGRSSNKIIEINCGSISPEMTDRVLFGHVKGAFTGATQNVAGIFELASGGTILLNDIEYFSLEQQAKFLGVLDVSKVRRLGEHGTEHDIDVRIIATTNKNIKHLQLNEELLPDFYARLNQWRLTIPPLRARKHCIATLSKCLLKQFASELQPDLSEVNNHWRFSDEVLALFNDYPWPGNTRELKTAIKNLVYLTEESRSPISLQSAKNVLFDEHDGIFSSYYKPQNNDTVLERDVKFQKALELSNGNISQAARVTGLSRTTAHKIIRNNGWEVRAKVENS